jgi:hypothetical protein
MIALVKHYNEKNIITAINDLIQKTGIFNKMVYCENGIKKTKYYIADNSLEVLNTYVKNNMPTAFYEKMEAIKNRTKEAEERLNEGIKNLAEKQKDLLGLSKNEIQEDETTETDDDYQNYLLGTWKEIINDYDADECRQDTFKEYKEYIYECYLGFIPQETDDDKIDIRLSDLMRFTDDQKTTGFYNTLIEKKKMIGGQTKFFYDTLKINFGFQAKNIDRINIIYE